MPYPTHRLGATRLARLRSRAALVPALALAFSLGCSDRDEPTAGPVVPAFGSAPAAPREHGTMVTVGTHPVEVVTHASGQVYAYVGPDVVDPSDAEMSIDLPSTSGRSTVVMHWDRRQARYVGRVARDTIVVGPLTVNYVIDDVHLVGFVTVFILAPAIVIEVDHHHGKHKHRHRGRYH